MPAIPEFMLRKLYVPESLKPIEGGFSFELNNSLAPVTLTGLAITLDEKRLDPGDVYLFIPSVGEVPVGGINAERPFSLALNMSVEVRVFAAAPDKRVVIRVDTREAGALQFGIPVIGEPVKAPPAKKINWLTRWKRRAEYTRQVFATQQDPQHPFYHFAPPANWMNDPNGLIYWKGSYHLFYQYNPVEPAWGNIHWGHAVSKDMLHWRHLPIALQPDPQGADAGGCFSGCAVDFNGNPALLYTGVFPETQCLALSQDKGLVTWRKHPQPVIPAAPDGVEVIAFRDPCVWQEHGEWRMALGSGLQDVGGAVLLYASKNLEDWQYRGMLFHDDARMRGPNWPGKIWECPSFFPLGDKWVLIVSARADDGELYTLYYTGRYELERFLPDGPARLLDGGSGACFYAPQTFLDRKGRRVMIGWLREARSAEEQHQAGWSGCASLPRLQTISERGDLVSVPLEGIETLRHERESLTPTDPISDAVRGASLELLVRVPPHAEQWNGVHLVSGRSPAEDVLIGCDSVNSAVIVDCRNAGGGISVVPVRLRSMQDLNLRIFVDGSVIEVFLEDGICITARFYMRKPQDLHVRCVGQASAEIFNLRL
jgi:beta-fructofuranosidase